jgi:hypothetical protein
MSEMLGYVDQHENQEDAINSIVKRLNSANKKASKTGLLGFSGYSDIEFSTPPGIAFQAVTVNHALGTIPSAWIVLDVENQTNLIYTITRRSWDTTSITFMVYSATFTTINIKIRLLA